MKLQASSILGLLLAGGLLLSAKAACAEDIRIENVAFEPVRAAPATPITAIRATFTLKWKHAWRNARNYDAAWVFFKLNKEHEVRSQRHGVLRPGTARLIGSLDSAAVEPAFWLPSDGAGPMVSPAREHRGAVSWRIEVQIDLDKTQGLPPDGLTFARAHAVEMVLIPGGPFSVGDSDRDLQDRAAAFRTGAGRTRFRVESEAAIVVGDGPGQLWYEAGKDAGYRGDARGPIPAEFPKGYQAFYVMKYELREGQYADFLNSIAAYWTSNRAPFGGRFYQAKRGGIGLVNGRYVSASPARPAGFLSSEDAMAWTDWAGLRPMTEFEFEKAARGPAETPPRDFPWGSADDSERRRYFDDRGDLVFEAPLDEGALTDANRHLFGASFYWVMDLHKGLWERCVTAGDATGRGFRGTHGDGVLRDGYFGVASNEDWPNGTDGRGGLSYRGGGFYEAGMVGSPRGHVADRQFGAWGEGPRDIAYGYRAVRTAP